MMRYEPGEVESMNMNSLLSDIERIENKLKIEHRAALAAKDARIAELELLLLKATAKLAATHSEDGREVPEVVGYGMPNTSIGRNPRMMMLEVDIPSDDQYGGAMWEPLMTVSQHARILAGKDAEIARLCKLAYIGEHQFEDCTYKFRLEELRAQPARQVIGDDPVAWHTDDHLEDKSATTYEKAVAERWLAKGWPVTPLYSAALAPAARQDGDERDVVLIQHQQWVSIKDQMPQIAQEVIVHTEFEGVCAGVLDSYGEWCAPCSDYKLTRVTHWMPLPEKPGEIASAALVIVSSQVGGDGRERFENHPRFKGMDFTRSATHPEFYGSPYANGAWDGWKVSAALAPAAVVKDSRYFRISGSGGVRYIRKSPNLALLMPGDTMEEFHFEDQLPKLIGIPSFNQED